MSRERRGIGEEIETIQNRGGSLDFEHAGRRRVLDSLVR
jgi:hypothetical protein